MQPFADKLMKTPKHDSLLEKWQVLAKSMTFHGFFSEMRYFLQIFAGTRLFWFRFWIISEPPARVRLHEGKGGSRDETHLLTRSTLAHAF